MKIKNLITLVLFFLPVILGLAFLFWAYFDLQGLNDASDINLQQAPRPNDVVAVYFGQNYMGDDVKINPEDAAAMIPLPAGVSPELLSRFYAGERDIISNEVGQAASTVWLRLSMEIFFVLGLAMIVLGSVVIALYYKIDKLKENK